MATDAVLISVEHLYWYYGDVCALQDVSFAEKRGEAVGLPGPNGSGETTAMPVFTGNLAPRLRVAVNGRGVLDDPRQAKAGLGCRPE